MSKDYQNNPINGEEHVHEQLSDYMDGLLVSDVRDAVRSHLETCADCRADYIEMRATRKLMQSMPPVAAPRAFTLTPEMAGKVRKPSFWASFFVRQNAPRLATGSLVAFLLLFVLIGNDFLGKANSQSAPLPLMVTSSQSPPSVSSGGAAQLPGAPGPSGLAAAAPTNTTAPNAAEVQGNAGGQDQTPHPDAAVPQPTSAPLQGFASAATPQESSTPDENSAGGSAKQGAQPNTVTASGNSSPTTTTLNYSQYNQTPEPHIAVPPSPAASPSENSSTGWIILQIGLLALGLGLGVAAFIAWRRS
jgi:anti-sigma factor RsiW